MVLDTSKLNCTRMRDLIGVGHAPLDGYETKFLICDLAASCGTVLHQYLENRQTGVSVEDVHMREPEDYVQCESWLATSGVEQIYTERYLERRGCLPLARICGSMDLVGRMPDGTLQICDYKRSVPLLKFYDPANQMGVRVDMGSQILSGEIVKYGVQLATYSKILRGEGEMVHPVAKLYVFHPLAVTWFCLELDLSQKLVRDPGGKFFCGLGRAEYGVDAECLSCLEVVELIYLRIRK